MKKIIVFVSVLFVTTALMFCLISQSNAIAATVEVGAGKTYAHPQDAVNAANPGDTILVYPGTYGPRYSACGWGSNETACGCGDWNAPALIVYKDNLTIQATGTAAETIIQSTYQCWSNPGPTERSTNGAVSSVTAPNGVSVIASGVTIEGFTLRSEYVGDPAKTSTDYPNTAGIMIGALYAGDQTHLNVTGTAVKKCIIYGHSGIYNWKASNTTIEGNTITIIADTPYPNTVNGNGVVVWDGWFEGVFPPTSTGVKILYNNINTCNVDLAHGGEGKGIMFGGTDTKNTPCEWCPPLNPSDANGADQSGMLIQGNTICAASTGIKFWNSIGTNKVITCDNTITFGTYKIHDYGVDESYPPSTWTEETPCTPTVIELSSFTAKGKKLAWVTESEIDNAGFYIWRADAENGEYVRLNDEIIPANGSTTKGAKYAFTDKTAKNRTTYFYKLQDIDVYGTSTFHGPVSGTPRFLLDILNK